MRLITKCSLALVCWIVPVAVFADPSLGDAAENLMGPIGALTELVLFACYIVGAALIIGGIMQYRIHRQNPKQVPLTTPIFYLIMGILLIFMPYLSTIAKTWSVAKKVSDEASYEDPTQTKESSQEDGSSSPTYWGAPPSNTTQSSASPSAGTTSP